MFGQKKTNTKTNSPKGHSTGVRPEKSGQFNKDSKNSTASSENLKGSYKKNSAWLRISIIMLSILIITSSVLYLDAFGLRAILFAKEKIDPISQVTAPADMIDVKLKAATRVDLLKSPPEPTDSAIDIYLKDGQLFIAEKNSVTQISDDQMGNEYKLSFSYFENTPNRLIYLIGHLKSPQYDMIRESDIAVINGLVGEAYTAIRLYMVENAQAEIQTIDNLSYNLQRNAQFIFPKTVVAHLSDDSTVILPVTWSPSKIDTAENGIRGSRGKVEGYSDEIIMTLVISETADGLIPNLTRVVNRGESLTLPDTLSIRSLEGKDISVPVIWSPDTIDTTVSGTVNVEGTVSGYLQKSILTVTVKEGNVDMPPVGTSEAPPASVEQPPAEQTVPPAPTKPAVTPEPKPAPVSNPMITSLRAVNATVKQGNSYKMPVTVVAVYSDGKTKNLAVSWNPKTLDTETSGNKTSVGSISGTSKKVTLTLTVTKSALETPRVAVSKITGSDAVVKVSGKVGASVLFNGSQVGTIGSSGVFTIVGINIDTLETVKITKNGWDPSPTVTTFVLF